MSNSLSLSFLDAHPEDAARVLEQIPSAEVTGFFDTISAEQISRVIQCMRPDFAALCFKSMDGKAAADVIEKMPSGPLLAIFRALRPETQRELLTELPDPIARRITSALDLPQGLVGAVTDSRVITVREESDIDEAIRRIRETPEQLAKYLYVLDKTGRLTGVVDVRALLGADSGTQMMDLMSRDVVSLPNRASIQMIREHPAWTKFRVLPVVDRQGKFQGILRHRDLVPVLDREGAMGSNDSPVIDTVMSLADIFWGASAELLASTANREVDSAKPKES